MISALLTALIIYSEADKQTYFVGVFPDEFACSRAMDEHTGDKFCISEREVVALPRPQARPDDLCASLCAVPRPVARPEVR